MKFPDQKWRYSEYGSLPSYLPTIHSNMSLVISSDRLDHHVEHSYRVWAFPQLRDHPNHCLSPETRFRRDISFDLASILIVPEMTATIEGSNSDRTTSSEEAVLGEDSWCWRDQKLEGNIPPPRVSAALCHSSFLGAVIVHGGLTMVTRVLAQATGEIDVESAFAPAAGAGGGDEMIQAPVGSAYLPTEALYCLPISRPLFLQSLEPDSPNDLSKMKTRQSTSGLIPSTLPHLLTLRQRWITLLSLSSKSIAGESWHLISTNLVASPLPVMATL